MSATDEAVARLETELRSARLNGARALREMHATMRKDLAVAERRARQAEKQLRNAEKRATAAEGAARRATRRADRVQQELSALRESATWRAGRAIVAVPARLRRITGR